MHQLPRFCDNIWFRVCMMNSLYMDLYLQSVFPQIRWKVEESYDRCIKFVEIFPLLLVIGHYVDGKSLEGTSTRQLINGRFGSLT